MKQLLIAVSVWASSSVVFIASANELDDANSITNYSNAAKDLPATLVMRVSEAGGSVAVFHSKEELNSGDPATERLDRVTFQPVEPNVLYKGELDKDTSRQSSFYFFFGFAPAYYGNGGYGGYGYRPYYPSYYYRGYNYGYSPYYSYYRRGYHYSYYRGGYGGHGGHHMGHGYHSY